MRRAAPLALAAMTFLFGVSLIVHHPAMYWIDPYGRVAYRDDILVGGWLPLLQLVVFAVGKVTASVSALRCVLAAIAALTVLTAYGLGARLFDPVTGLVFGALLATNSLFVALGIVPYQEVLFAGTVFAGLGFHHGRATGRRDRILAAVSFNLACLTRYEGWFLVAILAVVELVEQTARGGLAKGVAAAARLAGEYGAAAVGWLLFFLIFRHVPPTWEHHVSVPIGERLRSYFQLLHGQVGRRSLSLLAPLGLALALARTGGRRPHVVILAFVAADFAFVFFADPYTAGDLRRTFVSLVFLLLYAAAGLVGLIRLVGGRLLPVGRTRLAEASAIVLVVAWIGVRSAMAAAHFVAIASDDYRSPLLVGRWFQALPAEQRRRARIVMLNDDPFYEMAIAVDAGVPIARVGGAGPVLTPDVTHVVQIPRTGVGMSAAGVALKRRLDEGALPATATAIASSMVWTLRATDPDSAR